jgi:hypothetical protein
MTFDRLNRLQCSGRVRVEWPALGAHPWCQSALKIDLPDRRHNMDPLVARG